MKAASFYQSTGRDRVGEAGVASTKQLYTYNYLEYLPPSKSARIVDLGCSEGISLDWLAAHGYTNVVGVDSDPVAVEIANNRLDCKPGNEAVVCMDALAYLRSCQDDSADMIVMFNVIEHIPKHVMLEMMSEIGRVLKQGCYFVAQTGNWENPLNIGLFTRDFTHEVMYTQNSIRQLMVMSDFPSGNITLGAVRYRTTLRNFPLQVISPVARWLLKMFALSMRIHIRETAPLIYCIVKK